MALASRIIGQKWFPGLKIVSASLVGLALIAEILPEVEAKLLVVPALIVALLLGIVEILGNKRNQKP